MPPCNIVKKKGKTFLKVFPFFYIDDRHIFPGKGNHKGLPLRMKARIITDRLFPVAVLRIGHGNCSVNHMSKFRIGQKGK